MRRPLSFIALALFASVALWACGGSSGTPSTGSASGDPGSSANEVVIKGIAYTPETIEVSVGTTVTWTNMDPVTHTVTSGQPGKQGVPGVSKDKAEKPDGTFDQELAGSGKTFSFTFDKPGDYAYFCRIHSSMVGHVIVK